MRKAPTTLILCILSSGVALLGRADAAAQPRSLLESAVQALEGRTYISAKIRIQRVDLFGKQLIGSGSYLESRQEGVPKICLELRLQGGVQASLLQICDGRYLWNYRQMMDNEKPSLTRMDAVRLVEGLKRRESAPRPPDGNLIPGLGGLSRLLRSLDANFQFAPPVNGDLGPVSVWKLDGTWRPAHLVRLLPKQKEAIEQGKPVDLSRLPEHLPDRVVLFLKQGPDSALFPYRLEYWRTTGKSDGLSDEKPLATMELLEENLVDPIENTRFQYNPGAMDYTDVTEAYLGAWGLK